MKLTNNLYFYPENGGLDSNTYVIGGSPGIIVDPGNTAYLPYLAEAMGRDGLNPKDIGLVINTHLHADHCAANDEFRKLYGARVAKHPVQKEKYQLVVMEGARFFGMSPIETQEDYCLEGDSIGDGDSQAAMIHAPGHSPDSICYYLKEDRALICGDVIFHNNVGRVDIPGGSLDELVKSIEMLAALEVDYLLPGHMGIVAGREAVEKNFRFVREGVLSWM